MQAIDLFNNWVTLGKDDGMELNHTPSVDYMLSLIPSVIINSKFRFLDIGCGTGWVVKKMANIENCASAVGIDGAEKMVQKAISNDAKSHYFQLDINNLDSYHNNFDIVFSMEVFYYLNNPEKIIRYVFNNLLKKDGCFVMGVDHYLENKPSLKWPIDLDVHMITYSILEWKKLFKQAGFSNIKVSQCGSSKDWSGTLVVYGEKI